MSRFVPLNDVLDLAMLASDDLQKRSKGRYLSYSKYIFTDLNLSSLRVAVRERMFINKKTNTIDLPCNTLELCSVDVMDDCGILYPVFRNPKLNDDIVDISSKKDCACEFKCGHSLCNTIKGYEAITSVKTDKMPNGDPISFTCVDRKAVDSQGFFYEQTQYPLRVYEDGEWTDTVLHTEDKKLCKVEVDENGCVCDTEGNIEVVCECCGINNISASNICIGGNPQSGCNPKADTWIYYCANKLDWFSVQCGCYPYFRHGYNNIYNISELGDRLIFPPDFGWDSVIIRRYETPNLSNIQIPFLAIDTFILGLKWWDCRFNDKKQQMAMKYEMDYTKSKWGLLCEYNKYRLDELKMMVTPPVFVPSYIQTPSDRYNR